MKLITRRLSNVLDLGNSVGLTLRPELLDIGVNPGEVVEVTLYENNKHQHVIVIKKLEKEKK